jgi:hypothetical protein
MPHPFIIRYIVVPPNQWWILANPAQAKVMTTGQRSITIMPMTIEMKEFTTAISVENLSLGTIAPGLTTTVHRFQLSNFQIGVLT